ncbi:MAG: DUF5662 family protein [Clostridiales bacterium]|nr:DUF5662 family protein [Clostridiales bacterium]
MDHKAWHHFCTITEHKLLVMKHCFQIGLFWQGLTHDLSKYSPVEFLTGVAYYQGDRSPNAAERDAKGYSEAWLHHKGRNRHHFEYWLDFSTKAGGLRGCRMPVRYLAEMVMDRMAASKVYRGKEYTNASAWEYYQRERPYLGDGIMHPDTKRELEKILMMLRDSGERRTFAYIRKLLKRGDYGSGS